MTERFDPAVWSSKCVEAIDRRDGDTLAELAQQRHPDGVFKFDDVFRVYGVLSPDEWIDDLIVEVRLMVQEVQR